MVSEEDLERFEQEVVTTLKVAFEFNPVEITKYDIKRILTELV